jgi:hypothetical protein
MLLASTNENASVEASPAAANTAPAIAPLASHELPPLARMRLAMATAKYTRKAAPSAPKIADTFCPVAWFR